MSTVLGITIPTCAKFENVNETRSFMNQFDSEDSYIKSRLTNLNVSLDVDYKMFNMSTKAGCTLSNDTTAPSSSEEYSFLFEQRMFELKMANYKEYIKNAGITFTDDFKSAVEKLPEIYDQDDEECRSKFQRFFDQFGHFMVSSAYGGGAIEMKITNQKHGSETPSFDEIKAFFSTCLFGRCEVSGSKASSASTKSKALLDQSTLHWYGGNPNLHQKETVTHRETMLKWQASLMVHPTMLTTEMYLEPISAVVECINVKKGDASYAALKGLLGGEFKVGKHRQKEETSREKLKMDEEIVNTRKETVKDPEPPSTCFPAKSVVSIVDIDGNVDQKQITDIRVGDKVIAWDIKRHRAIISEVIMFAHCQPNAVDVEYLKITLQDGVHHWLSANHLVMTGESLEATMAQNVKKGDILFTIDENGTLSPKKVMAVEKITESGIFCPITKEGNLVVNNVLTSCYASVTDHVFLHGLVKISAQNLAHLGLMPMRALNKFHLKCVWKIPEGQSMHPYIKWLCKLKLPWMENFAV